MATIELYRTGKRANSTLRPKFVANDSYESNTCEFFEPLDILNPTIILREEALPNLPHNLCDYNYVYIQNPLDRYYWITKWTRQDGLWYADCTVDYLGSWRNTILETQQYITRSSIEYNNLIPDSFYGFTYKNFESKKYTFTKPDDWLGGLLGDRYTGDRFIVGINNCYVQAAGTGAGSYESTNYFLMSRAAVFERVLPFIKSGGKGGDSENIQFGDYVTTIFALPISPNSDELFYIDGIGKKKLSRIWIGNKKDGESTGSGYGAWDVKNPNYGKTFTEFTFFDKVVNGETINPYNVYMIDPYQVVTRQFGCIGWSRSGIEFENGNKYTKMYIEFEPFGKIEIDSDYYVDPYAGGIALQACIQLGTGDCTLLYFNPKNDGYRTIATANLAVHIQMVSNSITANAYRRQTIQNWFNMVSQTYDTSMVSNIANSKSNGMTLNLPGTVPILNYATNITESIWRNEDRPPAKVNSGVGGSTGSALISNTPLLLIERYEIVGRDDERFGRPLCEKRILGSQLTGATASNNYTITNPGLVVCQGAQIKSGTSVEIGQGILAAERAAIETAMNGGIYLE